jgi:hypothetical protein
MNTQPTDADRALVLELEGTFDAIAWPLLKRHSVAAQLIANYRAAQTQEAKKIMTKLAELEAWKESALNVLNGIKQQEIGKEIGLTLGKDIGPEILPWIKAAKKDSERLDWLESDGCYWVEICSEPHGDYVFRDHPSANTIRAAIDKARNQAKGTA